MSHPETDRKRTPTAAALRRQFSRPTEISEKLKDLIVDNGLEPGDRLPQERELMADFKASKSTIREALGALHTQGLVKTRTGPGGGAFVSAIPEGRAMELLGNYFFFAQPSIADIYALRRILEPELAASVVGSLGESDFRRLHDTVRLYDHKPADKMEEYRQRLAELDFHSVLAELCPNRVLGFFCGFLQNLLRNLSICKRIYDKPNPELRESGLNYQIKLLAAFREGDADAARDIMHRHMCAAQEYMEACEAELSSKFLRLKQAGQRDSDKGAT